MQLLSVERLTRSRQMDRFCQAQNRVAIKIKKLVRLQSVSNVVFQFLL
jgi:hypothetical protein